MNPPILQGLGCSTLDGPLVQLLQTGVKIHMTHQNNPEEPAGEETDRSCPHCGLEPQRMAAIPRVNRKGRRNYAARMRRWHGLHRMDEKPDLSQ